VIVTQYDIDADRYCEDDPLEFEKVCERCGAGELHWREVFSPDGMGTRWALFTEHGRQHVCRLNPADFGVVDD
jgi:hypothetical protein